MQRVRPLRVLGIVLLVGCLDAAEHRGVVKFGAIPIPGAAVTAQQGDKKQTVLTDGAGGYAFTDLADGTWNFQVEMRGFAPLQREVQVTEPQPTPAEWTLTMLPLAEISAAPATEVRVAEAPKVEIRRPTNVAAPAPVNTTSGFQRTEVAASNTPPVSEADVTAEIARRAADGFLVNGSVNNAASSPFSTLPAFGNNRGPRRWPYNGNFGFLLDNSSLDARPYSLTGQDTPRPSFNKITGMAALSGPIRIPGLIRNGPTFTVNYQWTRNRNVTTQSALMPTEAERNGDFSNSVTALGTPVNLPGFGTQIPQSLISPQALALLQFYPLPNLAGATRFNYQVPIINNTHQDSLQFLMNRQLGRKDNLSGNFQMLSARTDNPNIFGFLATGRNLNLSPTLTWRHTFTPRMYTTITGTFTRGSFQNIPFWSNRQNISGDFGITGNNQEPENWGPPALNFANGIAALGEAQYSRNVNQTSGVTIANFWTRRAHNVTYGFDFRRLLNNTISQQDARGTFTFTGAAAGYDFAGFLLGVPDASAIAFGNADKYFRSNTWAGYIADDWRVRGGLSLNLGLRWEYGTPITELYGRLVNMSVGPNFSTATPIVARDVASPLVRPDRNNLAPRIGFAWRPFPASSMVVRGGYGIYYDASVYQNIANQMAQQAPLSTSLRVQNSLLNPLTLADGFKGSPNITNTTFGIDPYYRVGYAQNWQLSVQRDLPAALQVVVTYLGIKGTRAPQQFLPNTHPPFTLDPCLTCPSGFSYLVSNGNSTRQAGTVQLRRRLRNGFTAELQYTYSKSIDNAALGGAGFLTAQNWLDLSAERARSNFDQRHLMTLQTQYTTGATSLGALSTGKTGAFLREWTVATQLTFGTGLPLTPSYYAPVPGTGVTTSIRGDYTGEPIYDGPPGLNLNPAAFAIPQPGTWGNAGRNIITGPKQFSFNASMGRTFRFGDRFNGDLRVDATNVLNTPVFPSWNTVITSAQFGLPNTTNQMRTIQTSLRVRF